MLQSGHSTINCEAQARQADNRPGVVVVSIVSWFSKCESTSKNLVRPVVTLLQVSSFQSWAMGREGTRGVSNVKQCVPSFTYLLTSGFIVNGVAAEILSVEIIKNNLFSFTTEARGHC